MLRCCHVGFLNFSRFRFHSLYASSASRNLPSLTHFLTLSTSCIAFQETDTSSDDGASTDAISSYRMLRGRVQNYAHSGNLGKALETLDTMKENIPGRPTPADYNYMIMCYFKSKNVVLVDLHEIYFKMRRFGPIPNRLTYQILLNGLISVGGLKDAIFVLNEMLRNGFVPSYTMISRLLKKLLKVESISDAISVLEIMLCAKFSPCESDISALIQSLCKYGMIRKAFFFFSVLSDHGYFCRDSFYNPILWALSKTQQVYAAFSFFALLEKKGFVHSLYTYTALIYGLAKEKLWSEVFHVLDVMESFGCRPSLITYTIVIKLLCDDSQIDQALDVLRSMEYSACEPDLVTYNIVIRELCHQGRLNEVDYFVHIIDEKGLVPDRYTHASVCGGLLKSGRLELANNLLFHIILRGYSVDDAVYNIYLHSLCCNGSSNEALSIMERMMHGGSRPSVVSYNTIVKGFCLEKNIDEALRVLDCAKCCADGPDLVSFNTILAAACKLADSGMIRRILTRMEYDSIKFDVASATCLMKYYFTVGKIPECLKLLESMVAKGPQPNTVTLNTLLAGLCRNQQLGMATQIFNYLKGIGVSANTGSYNILMRASIRDENSVLLYELSREMCRWKIKPDVSTYGCFIYSLCKKGKLSVALHLRDQLRENGVFPDISIYNTLLKAMLMKGMFWGIICLLKHMAMDDCMPNEGSHEILRRAKRKGWMRDFPRGVKLIEFVMFEKVS